MLREVQLLGGWWSIDVALSGIQTNPVSYKIGVMSNSQGCESLGASSLGRFSQAVVSTMKGPFLSVHL